MNGKMLIFSGELCLTQWLFWLDFYRRIWLVPFCYRWGRIFEGRAVMLQVIYSTNGRLVELMGMIYRILLSILHVFCGYWCCGIDFPWAVSRCSFDIFLAGFLNRSNFPLDWCDILNNIPCRQNILYYSLQ